MASWKIMCGDIWMWKCSVVVNGLTIYSFVPEKYAIKVYYEIQKYSKSIYAITVQVTGKACP